MSKQIWSILCVISLGIAGLASPSGLAQDAKDKPRDAGARLDDAIARGLGWLARHQAEDGRWSFQDGRFPDKGTDNDVAATAFGLLPLLAANKPKEYDKHVKKGLAFLVKAQDPQSGSWPGGMYAHGLAARALCEGYARTSDKNLRRPAELALQYILRAQHEGGGWRYAPGQPGDTSVSGWQLAVLISARDAGLAIPVASLRKVGAYLDGVCTPDEGYGYVGPMASPSMSAVGLICRHRAQGWGPDNARFVQGVKTHVQERPPNLQNMYYTYFATLVMAQMGGETWKAWQTKLLDTVITDQDRTNGPMAGSWNSAGTTFGSAGGRLMQTSLCIMALEVRSDK